jgi:hypothetical protein
MIDLNSKFAIMAPIRRISKRQMTVETSIYGSELVASRIDTELIHEVQYMLPLLGMALDGSALMIRNNMSVDLNGIVPSNVLKEKHNSYGYH